MQPQAEYKLLSASIAMVTKKTCFLFADLFHWLAWNRTHEHSALQPHCGMRNTVCTDICPFLSNKKNKERYSSLGAEIVIVENYKKKLELGRILILWENVLGKITFQIKTCCNAQPNSRPFLTFSFRLDLVGYSASRNPLSGLIPSVKCPGIRSILALSL